MNYKLIHITPEEEEEENEYGEMSQPTKETVISQKEITSGASGTISEEILFKDAGMYRVEVSIGTYTTSHTLYISGDQSRFPIRTNPGKLTLATDKPIYQVGDVAKVAITSPEKGGAGLVSVSSKGHILEYRLVSFDDYTVEIEIPITQKHVP